MEVGPDEDMLRFNGGCFPCNDCHRVFDISGYMKFDRQVKVKEVKAAPWED